MHRMTHGIQRRSMDDVTDPFWSAWLELCSRRQANGFHSLSDVEKTFYAMNFLRGAVERGGFHSYCDMASRQEIEAAKAGFRKNGAPQIAVLLQTGAGRPVPQWGS